VSPDFKNQALEVFGLGRQKIAFRDVDTALSEKSRLRERRPLWVARCGVFMRAPADHFPPLLISGALSDRPTG
jgi:hypothetical protein